MDPDIWIGVGILVVVVFAVQLFRKPGQPVEPTDYDMRQQSSSVSDWDNSSNSGDDSSGSEGSCDSGDSSDSGCSDSGGSDD